MSIRTRIETIHYFLKHYREDIIKRHKLEQDIDAQLAQYEAQLRKSISRQSTSPLIKWFSGTPCSLHLIEGNGRGVEI